MTAKELIRRYQNNDNSCNEEGKRQFLFELLEYLDEEKLDEEIGRLIIMLSKSQEE